MDLRFAKAFALYFVQSTYICCCFLLASRLCNSARKLFQRKLDRTSSSSAWCIKKVAVIGRKDLHHFLMIYKMLLLSFKTYVCHIFFWLEFSYFRVDKTWPGMVFDPLSLLKASESRTGSSDVLSCQFAQASWHHPPRRWAQWSRCNWWNVWREMETQNIRHKEGNFWTVVYWWFNSWKYSVIFLGFVGTWSCYSQDVSFTATTPPSSQDCHRLQSINKYFFGCVWMVWNLALTGELSLGDWRSCPVALLLPAAGKEFSMFRKSFGRTLSTNIEPEVVVMNFGWFIWDLSTTDVQEVNPTQHHNLPEKMHQSSDHQ